MFTEIEMKMGEETVFPFIYTPIRLSDRDNNKPTCIIYYGEQTARPDVNNVGPQIMYGGDTTTCPLFYIELESTSEEEVNRLLEDKVEEMCKAMAEVVDKNFPKHNMTEKFANIVCRHPIWYTDYSDYVGKIAEKKRKDGIIKGHLTCGLVILLNEKKV